MFYIILCFSLPEFQNLVQKYKAKSVHNLQIKSRAIITNYNWYITDTIHYLKFVYIDKTLYNIFRTLSEHWKKSIIMQSQVTSKRFDALKLLFKVPLYWRSHNKIHVLWLCTTSYNKEAQWKVLQKSYSRKRQFFGSL